MRPCALVALLALGWPLAGWAQAGRDDPVERARAVCRAAGEQVKAAGRRVDGDRLMSLPEARRVAEDALTRAYAAEQPAGHPLVRVPWLKLVSAEAARAETPRDVAEQLHFAAERLAATCVHIRVEEAPGAAVDRPRLVAILSRPEFDLSGRDEGFLARLLLRVWTWLRDVLVQSEAVQKSALSLRAAFLLATGLAVLLLGWRVARARLTRRAASGPLATGAVALDDPATYEAGAAAALARGEGRESVRLSLLALLATLERARLAAPGRAATNREVCEQIAERGGPAPLAEDVRGLVAWYDRVWYGLAQVTPEEATAFVQGAHRLSAQAAQTRPREAT